MGEIILSILTPSIPKRILSGQLGALCLEIEKQIGTLPVEHLVLTDNKRRTVGEKRDALLRTARGQYVAFVDDDDWVSDDYVASIVACCRHPAGSSDSPDVITFRQQATVNGATGTIEFGLGNGNEAFLPGGVARRNAWHVCAWRRTLAILSHFPATNYGEDWAFAQPLCHLPNLRDVHIPKVLHYYRHDTKTTEAPPPR